MTTRNVFCRPLDDVCVPGMADLYRRLATEGVDGFHMIVCLTDVAPTNPSVQLAFRIVHVYTRFHVDTPIPDDVLIEGELS